MSPHENGQFRTVRDLEPDDFVVSLGPVEFPGPARVKNASPKGNGFFWTVTVGEDITTTYALPGTAPVTHAEVAS